MNIKRCQCSSLLRVAGALAISSLFTLSPAFAQAYDLGDARLAGTGDSGFTDYFQVLVRGEHHLLAERRLSGGASSRRAKRHTSRTIQRTIRWYWHCRI